MGYGKEPQFVGIFSAITLKSAEVVGIAKARAMAFEDFPVEFCALSTNFLDEMLFEIGGDAIVVEQCVIDVEEENEI